MVDEKIVPIQIEYRRLKEEYSVSHIVQGLLSLAEKVDIPGVFTAIQVPMYGTYLSIEPSMSSELEVALGSIDDSARTFVEAQQLLTIASQDYQNKINRLSDFLEIMLTPPGNKPIDSRKIKQMLIEWKNGILSQETPRHDLIAYWFPDYMPNDVMTEEEIDAYLDGEEYLSATTVEEILKIDGESRDKKLSSLQIVLHYLSLEE